MSSCLNLKYSSSWHKPRLGAIVLVKLCLLVVVHSLQSFYRASVGRRPVRTVTIMRRNAVRVNMHTLDQPASVVVVYVPHFYWLSQSRSSAYISTRPNTNYVSLCLPMYNHSFM